MFVLSWLWETMLANATTTFFGPGTKTLIERRHLQPQFLRGGMDSRSELGRLNRLIRALQESGIQFCNHFIFDFWSRVQTWDHKDNKSIYLSFIKQWEWWNYFKSNAKIRTRTMELKWNNYLRSKGSPTCTLAVAILSGTASKSSTTVKKLSDSDFEVQGVNW